MMVRHELLTLAGWFFLLAVVSLTPVRAALPAEKTEIVLGAVCSLTGANSMNGAEEKWAYEEATVDINKKGGVFVKDLNKKLPIKLIFADDKSAPDQAAAAMERLIKVDKIDLALSTNATQLNIAAGTICEKYKVFFLVVACVHDFIAPANFKWVSGIGYTSYSSAEVPFLVWDKLPEPDRVKKPVMMLEDDQQGQLFGGRLKQGAEAHGYKYVMDEPYNPGLKDFSSFLLKMKALQADALLFFGSPADAITLLRQMKDQQVKLRYIHGWKGFWPEEFVQAMGKDANYIIHDGFWTENLGTPGSKELGQKFRQQFKRDSVSIGLHYAIVQILAMAVERAGSVNSARVRDVVFGGEFKGTTMGDVKYDEKGLAFKPNLALQWWNGERMPVYPPVPGIWTVKMIPAN